jgi:hypothetical protein
MDQPKTRRLGALAAIGSAGLVAGALLLGTTAAHAVDTTPTPTTSSGTTSSAPAQGTAPQGRPGPGGSGPVRSDEKALSADGTATLTAAALQAVPGGTVVRVETDAGDAAYEVHMTKADGTVVTAKFDKNLALVKVEDGMGLGDPQMGPPAGAANGQAPNGQAPNGQAPATGSTQGSGFSGTTGASGVAA